MKNKSDDFTDADEAGGGEPWRTAANTVEQLLAKYKIELSSTAPGRHYTTCPQCSAGRSRAHQRSKVLGVSIESDTAHWGCNHCGWTGPEKGNGNGRGDNITATYDYPDADGTTLLFQKVRKQHVKPGEGRFWIRRPDGRGGWIPGIGKDTARPLYRLPEVIEAIAAGYTIAVVEGEKDADNLWRIGVPATCNFDGAADTGRKPKWKPEYSEALRGADIVVLNDNDAPGYAHADTIAHMSLGIAKKVRRLDLAKHWPDMPPGKDVSDWLALGHTREELDALIEWAPDYSADGSTRDAPKTAVEQQGGVRLEDFIAYMPQRSSYFFTPSRDLWPGTSVDARLPPVLGPDEKPIKPSAWLAANAAVEQTTWAPGEPMVIEDRLISDGGWIERPGCHIFNLYRPPALVPRTGNVAAWLDLVRRVFPDQADHIILWLAHRVQRPNEKVNHALVLGGKPGIGKDTILEPVKQAIGPWNFADESPHRVLGSFNSFARSVILRISEARDLGDWDRFAFFERMKALIAAPPDVVRINEKHLREYYVPNLCGVIITTNHKTDGIYLPADDRRHLVAWSNLTPNDFADDYWRKQYWWYANGGNEAVAAYLASLDLSAFDPKAPPPKTGAFWEIANANRAPEDAELQDVLDDLGRPEVVTLDRVASQASVKQPAFAEWLRDSKANARRIPHRFEDCGYVAVRNPNDSEGRWKIKGRRHTIYGKVTLTERERLAAALEFTGAR